MANPQWLQMYEDFISSGMGRQAMENLVLGMSERDLISFELDDHLAELDLRDYINVLTLHYFPFLIICYFPAFSSFYSIPLLSFTCLLFSLPLILAISKGIGAQRAGKASSAV